MAFKQKSGSPFQRNFGIGKSPAKQASPMKEHKPGHEPERDPKGPTPPGGGHDPNKPTGFDFEGNPIQMKSSGFKMKSSSPFQENFGVGSSPMKKFGIYPVDEEGMITGPAMGSTEADLHVASGGDVIKTGPDRIASERAELEGKIKRGEISEEDLEEYQAGDVVIKDFDESDVEKGDRVEYFKERAATEATAGAEDLRLEESDEAAYKESMGDLLYNKEIEIQNFKNKFPNEPLPGDLKKYQGAILRHHKQQQRRTKDMTEWDTRYGKKDVLPGGLGRIESGEGEIQPYVSGLDIDVTEPQPYHSLETDPSDISKSQVAGTSKDEERIRLADIQKKKNLAKDKLAKEQQLAEDKRLEEQGLAEEKIAKEKDIKDRETYAGMKEENETKMEEWGEANPPPKSSDFGKGKRGRKKYNEARDNYWNEYENYEKSLWEDYEGEHYTEEKQDMRSLFGY